MISRNFDLVLRGNDARLREKIYVYRGDYGIDLKFNILDSLDYYLSERNDLEGTAVTILFTNPSGDSMYTTESTIREGFVTFRITEDMTDDFEEIGEYTLQIRLIGPDYRVTIPAFKFNVSPIISDTNGSIIGTARVGFARVAASGTSPVSDLTLFSVDSDGYIKTNWQNGDVITREKMNKIESGIFDNSQIINDVSNTVDDMGRDIRQIENKIEREIEENLENVQNIINTEVSTMQRNIRSLQRKVNENTQNISDNADNDIIQDSSIRALRRKVSVLEMLADGGSGVVIMALANVTDVNVTTLPDHDVDIRYEYSASYDTAGIVTYNINGVDIRSEKIEVGVISFNPRPYLKKGSNTINISVNPLPGDNGRGDSITFNVEVIDVALNSNFNYQKIYKDVIDFNYTPVGAVEKTVHILLDEEEIYTETVISSGIQRSYQIPKQSHGTHLIEAYMEAVVGGSTITTNMLSYEIITVVDGNNTPIISMNYRNEEDITQYSLVSIPYAVYKDNSVENDIELFINDVSKGELVVDRSWKTWSTTDYPIGEVEFKITCGNVSRSIYVNVIELDVEFKEATEGLEFYMSSANRTNSDVDKDQYSYGAYNVAFNDFNWITNGWIADNGVTALKICDGATVDIPITPFANDFKTLGKTIEFDFSVEDSINDNAIVCSCMSGDRGFQIKSKEAIYKTNEIEVDTKFKDKERIRVSFVVEGSGLNSMIYTYIDGIVSGLNQYTSSDIFTQPNPVSISLGSTECTIKLYSIRIYNRSLKINEVVDNFIYDLTDITRKLDLYAKNNVFDSHDQIMYNRILDQVPCMIITGELPPVKGEKKTVSIKYEDKVNFDRNFEYSGCILDIQGTSSQYYPKKNYKFKLPETYALRTNSIPVNEFCIKADYMESSHAHNTGMAKFAESLYTEKVPPQVIDSRVRTTIDGFIIALFHRQTANSELQYFGVYNFNNDKGTPDTFGYSGNCECWEVCNNTSPRCLFQLSDYDTIDTGEGKPAWQVDFEARYPDKNTDYTALKRLTDWLVSTKNNPTKFKNEFNSYLNLHYTLMYYIITEFFAMADSRAKNLFLATWDKQIWYPVLYDMDTMMGLNNEGVLEFRHNVESSDVIGTQNVFNGKNSLLWLNVEAAFNEEIITLYRNLRNSGLLTYDTVTNTFINEQISKICQAQYNEDAQYKYISPLINDNISTYLYVAQGSREHHMKYWLDSRFKYMDSKFRGFEYMDNYATFRLYTPSSWSGVRPNPDFDITLFNDQYIGVKYGSYEQFTRANANQTVHVTAPSGITFNDTETIIYGATNIASLGDLSNKYAGTVDVSKATQLDELILGSTASGYRNANLKSVSVGNNRLLRTVNVANCPNLTGVLDLSSCVAIESIEARGSSISSVSLSSGGNLEEMYLPGTITNLEIINKPKLHTLLLESFDNVTILNMRHCGNINPLSILGNCVNVERVRLMDLDCSTSYNTMEILIRSTGMTDDGTECPISQAVSGNIHIIKCSQNQYDNYRSTLPLATITVGEIVEPLTVIFKDGDGNSLCAVDAIYGGSVIYPLDTIPTKTSTAQYDYTWVGWDRPLTNITSDCIITATFTQTIRSYTVRFIDGSTMDLISTQVLQYGSTPTKPNLPAGSNFWGVIESVVCDVDYISKFIPYPDDLSVFSFVSRNVNGVTHYTCRIKGTTTLPRYLVIPFEYDGNIVDILVQENTNDGTGKGNVEEVYLPETITHISGAFANMKNLTSINTEYIRTISGNSFASAGKLTHLTFPNVTQIDSSAFKAAHGLVELNLPKLQGEIPNNSFDGCTSLKTIVFPETVTTIRSNAFIASGFTHLVFPKSVTTVEPNAIKGSDLRYVYLPGVTNITLSDVGPGGIFIFGSADTPCTSITCTSSSSSYAPAGLIAVNNNPSNVSIVTNDTFSEFDDNVAVDIIPENSTIVDTGREWYIDTGSRIIFGGLYNDSDITTYSLENVNNTQIPASGVLFKASFKNCTNVEKITLSQNITKIHRIAFNNCSKLREIDASYVSEVAKEACITLPAIESINLHSAVNIGSAACRQLRTLKYLNIDNAVNIADEAFKQCTGLSAMNKLILPKATNIGYQAFYDIHFVTIHCPSITDTANIGDDAFHSNSANKSIFIGSKDSGLMNLTRLHDIMNHQKCTFYVSVPNLSLAQMPSETYVLSDKLFYSNGCHIALVEGYDFEIHIDENFNLAYLNRDNDTDKVIVYNINNPNLTTIDCNNVNGTGRKAAYHFRSHTVAYGGDFKITRIDLPIEVENVLPTAFQLNTVTVTAPGVKAIASACMKDGTGYDYAVYTFGSPGHPVSYIGDKAFYNRRGTLTLYTTDGTASSINGSLPPWNYHGTIVYVQA